MLFNRKYFDKVFREPDPWGYDRSRYEQTKYLRQVEAIQRYFPEPRSILEIGCAEGICTTELARTFPRADILGMDISPAAIQRARQRCECYPAVRFVEGDVVEALRRDSLKGQFDVVIQSESLYYLFPSLVLRAALVGHLERLLERLNHDGIMMTCNGINFGSYVALRTTYFILGLKGAQVFSRSYREWNDVRGKYTRYDIKIFRRRS